MIIERMEHKRTSSRNHLSLFGCMIIVIVATIDDDLSVIYSKWICTQYTIIIILSLHDSPGLAD
jgi:hypothetical protein